MVHVRLVVAAAALALGCPSSEPAGTRAQRSDASATDTAVADLPTPRAPTAEEIREEFQRYLASANQCQGVEECAVAVPGCPLGCFVGVRADRKSDVEAKARALIQQYSSQGGQCVYECPAVGPLACQASRCTVAAAGAPDAGVAPETGGGVPAPYVQLAFDPGDGATGVQGKPLVVTAYDNAGILDEDKLAELARLVAVETWPEKMAVASRSETQAAPGAQAKKVLVTPAAPLESRWYLLRLTSLPAHVDYWPRLDDGTVGVRFRPDSQPRVTRVDFCTKAATGMKLVLLFSESVTVDAGAGALLSVEIAGRPAACELYENLAGGLYFTCADLTATSMVKVSLGAGLKGTTGVALAPASWSIDVGKLPGDSCRSFRTPI